MPSHFPTGRKPDPSSAAELPVTRGNDQRKDTTTARPERPFMAAGGCLWSVRRAAGHVCPNRRVRRFPVACGALAWGRSWCGATPGACRGGRWLPGLTYSCVLAGRL